MKKLLIISIIFILLGALIAFIALIGVGFNFSKFEKMKSESFSLTEEISSIEIVTDDTDIDVIIREGTEDTASISAYYNEKCTLTYSVTDGKLTVAAVDNGNFLLNMIDFFASDGTLTLTLPKKTYESLTANVSTGDVTVQGLTLSGDLSIDASTADLKLSSVKAASVSLKVSTGKIDVNRASSLGAFTVNCSTGDVSLEGITASSLKIEASTADIDVEKATLGDIESISTSSGEIDLSEVYTSGSASLSASSKSISIEDSLFMGKLTVNTSSADLKVENSDAYELEITTSSGHVRMNLLTAKNFVTETSSGKVDVIGTIYTSPLCKIKTSSGDIKVRIGAEADD